MKRHSWDIDHFIKQAKGCQNRIVDSERLASMPHLRGTCHICCNFKPVEHMHRDSPIASIHTHRHCANQRICGVLVEE